MQNPEILAPAGSFDSLKAAVFCGADAVYLGGKSLNARKNADNFDDQQLKEACDFAHERGVKVYETLNVLMLQGETDELLKALETACRIGVDGIMVQDFGVLSIIKKAAPSMKCFASTQMAVHNLDGVLKAAELGCSRVVLARELSRGEIIKITAASPVPIEVFVHGALCMCISGQCYLSAMLGGRSGNRGNCAQPCRLPFKIGENKNALSLKDLSLINELGELKKIGVSSVKIEGRMKRPEYVAAAVTAVKASFEGKTANMEELQKIFSRSGFTKGYYDSRRDINMFGIRQKEDVVSAKDVLSSLGHLAEIEIPRVPLFGEFSALENQPMTLTVSDSKANSVTVEGDIPEEAHTRSTDVEHVVASLSKTGGTPYFFDDIETEIGENLMIKISQLNSLRRESLEKLGEKRREITPKPFENILPQTFPAERLSKFFIRVRCDERQLSPDIIKLADEILIPYNQYEALLRLKCDKEKIVLEIPRVMFDNESTVRREINGAKSLGITKVWVGNIGSLRPCQEEGMIINGGWSLNLANNYATDLLRCEGAVTAEISPEIMLTQAECINSVNMGIIAYGYLPLMTFRNCPVKANLGCEKCGGKSKITDRMGIDFLVSCKSGTPELLNSVPIYLADRIDELSSFDFATLWFNFETAAECMEILKEYKGLKAPNVPKNGHTRGLYYRGTL